MGLVESIFGGVIHRLLMPTQVPAWYADKPCLPDAHSDSLLLLGRITLQVRDLEAARRFYVGAMGFHEAESTGKELRLLAGASELRLRETSDPQAWPGHIYVWVRETTVVLGRCRELEQSSGAELVEDVHNVTAAESADALELKDPDGNCFLVNKAPRDFEGKLRKSLGEGELPGSDVLAIVEALHLVPPGVALQVAKFYRKVLGAAVSSKDDGWAVHFAPSKAMRQTMCFMDDADTAIAMESTHEVCIYMPTEERFKEVFDQCAAAGVLADGAAWAAVSEAGEFTIPQCFDPDSKAAALELETVVRSPSHEGCRLVTSGQNGAAQAKA